MRKTDTDGKRVADGGRPVKMPAKRKPAGMNRNLIVLIVSVVVVSVLVVVMSLIHARTSENKKDSALPDSHKNRTEMVDTKPNDAEPNDASQDHSEPADTNQEHVESTDTGWDHTEPTDVDQNHAESTGSGTDSTTPSDAKTINKKLLGTWSFNGEATYSFDNNNRGQLDIGDTQFVYTYEVSGNRLMLNYEDEAVVDAEYRFSVEKNSLTLEGGAGTSGGTYKLSRVN